MAGGMVMGSSFHSPAFSILCVAMFFFLWAPCLLRTLRTSLRLPKDARVAKAAKALQKKHVLVGKLFPVAILIHAVTSFSQLDINVLLGLACLLLAIDFPGRRRRKKDWLKVHTVKAKAMVILLAVHIIVQAS